MKRLYLLFALAVLAIVQASAQVSLSGNVKSTEGEALPGASVVLVETSNGTITDAQGNFILRNIKPGNYHIKISFIGYYNFETSISLINNQKIEVVLNPSSVVTDEIVVNAYRAGSKTPVAHTDIKASDFKDRNLGSDITYLMQMSPSIVTSSDAGQGVGYTSIRVRGTDANRINVTINGMPLNDAESSGVYWVDLPDFASSVDNIQVQRGVGTSTNGAGAFGASFNFQTQSFQDKPYAEINSAAGSFNTFKNTVMLGTGLLNKHFNFEARLSAITSDGYIDRASSNLQSYYVAGGYLGNSSSVRIMTFGGKEKTYQAWNGVPMVRLKNDTLGMLDYLANSDLTSKQDSINMFSSGRTYNAYWYPNQTDNYQQRHYQVLFNQNINQNLSTSLTLHYTHGEGYYEELKESAKLAKYLISNVNIGSDSILNQMGIDPAYTDNGNIVRSDLITQKWLNNDFYGAVATATYSTDKLKTTLGGGYSYYYGHHYGYVIWSRYAILDSNKHEWYRATGKKTDWNGFIRTEYTPFEQLTLYADLQERGIQHDMNGFTDKRKNIKQSHSFNFFNPKIGATYSFIPNIQSFISWGRSHREPNRNNYVDADSGRWPTAERLDDIEVGFRAAGEWWKVELNGYYMYYDNQLVLTGAINDTGDAIMTNVKDSYREGLELSGILKPTRWFEINGNITLSRNKIKNYTEYVDNWGSSGPAQYEKNIGKSDLSFSPNVIWNSRLKFIPVDNFAIEGLIRHVGKQYIDNSSSDARKLDAYTVTDLILTYKIFPRFMKELSLSLMINNLFSTDYISNAWVYRYYTDGSNNQPEEKALDGYFPQAFRNYMIGLSLRF
jgi:iron complex outermembrane recepter protein